MEAEGPPPELAAAVQGWSRYQVERLVGAGGGGFVWRARDPRVGRAVALKFLRVADANQAARLLREAQAQARVDHPSVCKVYDVGSLDGRPYIVMQYSEGRTLDQVGPSLSLEARVTVMRQVADAIHAAHRIGLIHRDLKPANVLVEESEPGVWKAYVLDFGLARELAAPGLTTTGVVVGTPAYMAPEQARGDSAHVDRRSDVYGLGASLYQLLTGRPPFQGTAAVEVTLRVLGEDPLPPRKLDRSIPVDLETITLKCLEKEPERRYASARAVADDLGRFLDGEPIEARRAGAVARAWRWARKRRALVAAGAAALAAVLAGGSYGLAAQRASSRRARAAAEFGRDGEQIQSAMERVHLLPLHDLRPEASAVRRRLAEIESRIGELGAFAEGPGRQARGRGFLALYEYSAARAELERAWQAGEHTPEVALALGQALGELYQARRSDALRLQEPLRTQKLDEARRELRDPALLRLRDAGDATPYVEGLIALYEERWDDALAQAQRSAERDPWLYRALRLQAQALTAIADGLGAKGDYDGARAKLEAVGAILERALAVGRSDPELLETACRRYLQELRIERRRNGALGPLMDGVTARCGDARTADADRPGPWAAEAAALDVVGTVMVYEGKDPEKLVTREIDLAEHALALDPRHLPALLARGGAWETRADWQTDHGADPVPALRRALEDYQRLLTIDSNSNDGFTCVGRIHGKLGMRDSAAGRDPSANLELAAASYRRAAEKYPTLFSTWENLGVVEWARGDALYAAGGDPTPMFRACLDDCAHSLQLNPRSVNALLNGGAAHSSLADLAFAAGGDNEAELQEAERMTRKALEIYPGWAMALDNLAEYEWMRAEEQLIAGKDPSAALDRGRRVNDEAVKSDAAYALAFTDRGRLELIAARAALRDHRSPAQPLAAAGRALDRAIQLDPNDGRAWVQRAWWHRWRAAWRASADEIAGGLADAARAQKLNPRDGEAHAVAGVLQTVAGHAKEGEAELARALELDHWLKRRIDAQR